jgi:glycosyltransferase involved in cell wall biosynthesis
MSKPLVTISIPTYNSEKFIKTCLQSVFNQTYKNIEINVIDGGSKDKTLEIINQFKIKKIVTFKGPLLGARYEGVKIAKGKYILILDSDQVLTKNAVARSVQRIEKGKYDMLALEEEAYKPQNWVEKLFHLDKKLVHEVKDLSPFTGVILPRFYKKNQLEKAFKNIPQKMLKGLGGQDHAIIYYEAWRIGKKVGLVPKSVRHIEPDTLIKVCRKAYRWGYTSVSARYSKYSDLVHQKERFRTGLFKNGMITESLASITVLLMKGIPYKLGYLLGKTKKNLLRR